MVMQSKADQDAERAYHQRAEAEKRAVEAENRAAAHRGDTQRREQEVVNNVRQYAWGDINKSQTERENREAAYCGDKNHAADIAKGKVEQHKRDAAHKGFIASEHAKDKIKYQDDIER